MPSTQLDEVVKEAYRQLLDISCEEARLIAAEDIDSVFRLQDRKETLRNQIDKAIRGDGLSRETRSQVRAVAQKILAQDKKNGLELERRRADVAKSMKDIARLHEWSAGIQRTLAQATGGRHDSTA